MSLKYLAAYALISLAGKQPDAATIARVLSEGGVDSNDDEIQQVLTALQGREIHEVISEGLTKVQSFSFGGGSGAGASAAAKTDAPVEAKKQEAPKEEPKEEVEEDFDAGGLFGDDF